MLPEFCQTCGVRHPGRCVSPGKDGTMRTIGRRFARGVQAIRFVTVALGLGALGLAAVAYLCARDAIEYDAAEDNNRAAWALVAAVVYLLAAQMLLSSATVGVVGDLRKASRRRIRDRAGELDGGPLSDKELFDLALLADEANDREEAEALRVAARYKAERRYAESLAQLRQINRSARERLDHMNVQRRRGNEREES